MYKSILIYFFVLGIFPIYGIAADAKDSSEYHIETSPDINGWGFDLGFGTQPYMESATKLSLISPFLFEGSYQSNWRITLDYSVKTLQAYSLYSLAEVTLSLESDARIYKDIVYSFVKFGLGTMLLDDDLYDGSVMTAPISLGFHVITMNSVKGVLSYFVEYRFNVYNDYEIEDSLPSQTNVGLDEDALFSGQTSLGIRLTY